MNKEKPAEPSVIVYNQKDNIRYVKGAFLGKGGFAKCYEFRTLDGSSTLQAGKVIAKSGLAKARARQKLQSEIKIHRSLHHENIVGFNSFFEDDDNVYILLDLCSNSTLNDQVKRRKRLTELEV